MKDPKAFGAALREARRIHGLTQFQVALETGVSISTVHRAESGVATLPAVQRAFARLFPALRELAA
jgi:transcriptional regulator with XRE-family HTH domain